MAKNRNEKNNSEKKLQRMSKKCRSQQSGLVERTGLEKQSSPSSNTTNNWTTTEQTIAEKLFNISAVQEIGENLNVKVS